MEESIDYGFIYLVSIASLSILTIIIGFISVLILYQKRIVKNIHEKQALESKHQQDLLKGFIETQEKERKRIAADLHDEIGASLAAIRMNISRIKALDNVQNLLLEDSVKMIIDTADNARKISHNLMPPALETIGLFKVIDRLIKNLNQSNIEINFTYDPIKLDSENELAFYRIINELINNSLKYSSASLIQIKFTKHDDSIFFSFIDNGKGYDAKTEKGLGLKNIQSRAQSIGAELKFHSEKGKTGIELIINDYDSN